MVFWSVSLEAPMIFVSRRMASDFSSKTFRLKGGDGSGRLLWRRTLDGASNHPMRVLFYDLLVRRNY